MKSQKAKEFIDQFVEVYGKYMPDNERAAMRLVLENIIGTTEREAEKRIKEELYKMVDTMMGIVRKTADEFIKRLNDDEND